MQTAEPLIFSILDIVQITRSTTTIATNNKSCYALSCRTQGESLIFYNNESHKLKRGEILYVPYGASYSQTCSKTEEIIYFHLNITGDVSDKVQIFTPDDPDEICALFSKAAELWKNKSDNYVYYCMSILYQIVALTNAALPPSVDMPHNIISPSIKYLHTHMYENTLSLEDICKESHISKTCFIKHFRDIYGCTPIKYINVMRINKAQMLLKTATYTNTEIALLCGFHDVKYFYVLFKKLTGFTTNEYLQNEASALSVPEPLHPSV